LPFGFPERSICFEERQKLASLKHLPLWFSNQLLHSGCVTWEMVVQNQNTFLPKGVFYEVH